MNMFFLAYTDPGTGIMLWQILAAFGIGILFYVKRIFLYIKSFFVKKKKINNE